ncbi:type VII secretion protein EccB [Skermania sp. ID1734]|uniref:type VII secretion protein EccB n=1 Tax=Skermania sp. ID1734 TaxID=2597516 RepID=UPI00117CC77A|nr:type VII secretion protein EccB [Skermania sp. ID1734]TSE02110.1 type VII secretion protein EccB [Skermania sp. ID1734]
MGSEPTTRSQVSGYRFLARRMEHALVRRDVRMLHDPIRAQSRALAVGAVLSVLAVGACAVLAVLRPAAKIGDHKIVVGQDSGAMFVVLGDTVHPVLNLASARLAANDPANPVLVKESELGTHARGALVGIPGAPSALPFDRSGASGAWTVCDALDVNGGASTTSVIIGATELGDHAGPLGQRQALLVQTRDATYLVYDGKRARIDLRDHAVTNAYALSGVSPRPISAGLLNSIPEVPPITAPHIDGAGSAPSYTLSGKKIGSVVAVQRGEQRQYYVLLREGVQAVSPATADLIRFADSQGNPDIEKITPDTLTRVPLVSALDVATFPETAPTVIDSAEKPVACLSWKPVLDGQTRGAEIGVLIGRSLPVAAGAAPVQLVQSDHSGDRADTAYIRPGTGAFVQTTGLADSSRADSIYYIADTGVRFGVSDFDAAKALGFDARPHQAPWSMVALLAAGPTLGRAQALLVHDGVAPDPAPGPLPDASAN